MRRAITLGSWQFTVMLNHLEPQRVADLKLPSETELKTMVKAVYRKFYEAKRG